MEYKNHFLFLYSVVFGSCQMLCMPLTAADIGIIVPAGLTFTNGDAGTAVPFLIEQAGLSSTRYQQVYAAAQFSALQGAGGLINSLLFRADEHNTHPIQSTIGNIQIDLSTTAALPDGLSATFANNVGSDDSVVYSGSLFLTSLLPVTISLSHPFFYNPSQGNLLLDVRNFTGALPPIDINSPFMDAANDLGDAVSCVYASNVGAATGTPSTVGLVTGFIVTPIPEPGTWALLLLGTPAIIFVIYRKNKNINKREQQWH